MKKFLSTLLILSSFSLFAQNRALNFDGGNDYVQTTFSGITGSSNRTFEAWIFVSPTAPSSNLCIMDYGLNAVGSRNSFSVSAARGLTFISGGTNANISTSGNLITLGQWTHVAFVLNNSTGYLYVNGVQSGTGNLSTVNTPTTGTSLRIGQRVAGGSIPFKGSIDEVRVWNTALSATQILANMNGEFCAPPSNLQAYYKFNHGAAGGSNTGVTTLVDNSGNSNNGTLNGFALTGATSNWVLGNASITPASILIGGTDTVSACAPYLLPSGLSLTSTGIYNDTATSNFGCDSAYIVNYTALPNSTDSFAVTQCDGYFAPSGAFFGQSGKYVDVLSNSIGCDSLITINLTINSSKTDFQTLSACKSFLSPAGNTYTASGTYFDTLATIKGCDSVIVSNLTITSDIIANINTNACDTFITNKGAVITTTSIFSDTVFTGTGCDSIFNYNIQMGYTNGSNASGIGCLGSFTSDLGNKYTSTGQYTEYTTNAQGCDSIINLDVIISTHKSVQLWDTICRKRSSPSGNYLWTTGGWKFDTIATTLGCDSNIQMFLVVEDIDTTVAFVDGTFRAIEVGVNYSWLDCNSGNLISGENGRTFKPTQDGSYASIVSNGVCTDTSGCKTITLTLIDNLGKKGSINIFPNPTYNSITISYLEVFSVIKVTNLHDQIVFETQTTSPIFEVNLTNLPSGVYQVAIEASDYRIVKKVIKK